MGIRWLKMGKISDKMRQDGVKMRKMKDFSSVLAIFGPERRKKQLTDFAEHSGDGGP